MGEFLIYVGLGLSGIFLIALPIVKAFEVSRELRGQRMGIQLQLYLYSKGASAARAISSKEFDAGHVRDLLESALAGSIPATLVLAELASLAQQAGASRIESAGWLYIIQVLQSSDQEVDKKRKVLAKAISDRLGHISTDEADQASRMRSEFLNSRIRFLNGPLPSQRRKFKEVRDARR
jgi:hypothetical protein